MPVAVEMKRRVGKLAPEQERMHELMHEAGWHVVVGYGSEDAIRKLQELGY